MARAVRFHEYGDIDVLRVEEIPDPTPGEGEVVVAVKAAGINPGEAAIRSGAMQKIFPGTLPSGQGSDLAGVVTAVGPGVTDFSEGDEVLGYSHTRSSQATATAVPANQLIPKPAEMSWETAGGMYVVACTAYAAVHAIDAKTSETVVVSAAAGGVGGLVVQLLADASVTPIAIASEANADWLLSKGATPVAYGEGLEQRIREAVPNHRVDAFIDLFGPEYIDLAVRLGVGASRIETIISFEAAGKIGAQTKGSTDASNQQVLAEMARLISTGRIELPIAATYPLDQVREAYTELEKRHTRGKIVLIP